MKETRMHLCLEEPVVFERGSSGRRGVTFRDESRLPEKPDGIPEKFLRRRRPLLPEMSEGEVVRHFTRLSSWNFSIDAGFYPLGSCTMKYNPRINEQAARLAGFAAIHPYSPAGTVQGALQLMYELEKWLCSICGFKAFTLQPAAGAHGELTSLLVIRRYLESTGNPRKKILIPDTAHGTNPATSSQVGYETVKVISGGDGILHPEGLAPHLDDDVAAVMITNPNTLGLFEKDIRAIAEMVHGRGGLVFGDGANLNALIGKIRPADLGIDVMQLNLHKTFSTPHGGGGPGSGPVGVVGKLEPFLPVPRVRLDEEKGYWLDESCPDSIGRVRSFYGNFGVMVRAYAYLLAMGRENIPRIAEMAVLNANYLSALLGDLFHRPYGGVPMHEFVVTDHDLKKETGVDTTDVAKRLIDSGFHPPTIHFPLVVHGALMIEPTETETPEAIEEFAAALRSIVEEARRDPETVKGAPHKTRRRRPNDTLAARKPVLVWRPEDREVRP
jgi:glycine dehydrogenase subunit 2